jgi:hypothetical protein
VVRGHDDGTGAGGARCSDADRPATLAVSLAGSLRTARIIDRT